MNSPDITEPRKAQAEAVAWLARLRGPDRSRELEEGLKEWLRRSPANAAAFEKATELWEELGGVSAAALLKHRTVEKAAPARPSFRVWITAGASAFAVFLAAVMLILGWDSDSDLSTRIGEQRTVTLSDGSRMALNTDTRVVVEPWGDTREVRLERGEAYFEVAKNPQKPFVVVAGTKKVVAIGTAFVVRRDASNGNEKISVTLVEGKVAVTDVDVTLQAVFTQPEKTATLEVGERMAMASSDSPAAVVDRPKISAVTAWRRGEVVLDNTRLADAIEELNRYSPARLSIADEAAADLPVSGIFRTGDSESFATAVASLYGMAVSRDAHKIVLSGNPAVR